MSEYLTGLLLVALVVIWFTASDVRFSLALRALFRKIFRR